MNPMKQIRIEKVTLNIGSGKNQDRLEKALKLLKLISNKEPVKCITKKRIQGWGIRPGLAIGAKVTLRKEEAKDAIKRLVEARDNHLEESNFDENGNVSFGLTEYIDIPGMKYDPDIGSLGLQACITLIRPGFRVKRRKIRAAKIATQHKVNKKEAIEFMSGEFKIKVGGEE